MTLTFSPGAPKTTGFWGILYPIHTHKVWSWCAKSFFSYHLDNDCTHPHPIVGLQERPPGVFYIMEQWTSPLNSLFNLDLTRELFCYWSPVWMPKPTHTHTHTCVNNGNRGPFFVQPFVIATADHNVFFCDSNLGHCPFCYRSPVWMCLPTQSYINNHKSELLKECIDKFPKLHKIPLVIQCDVYFSASGEITYQVNLDLLWWWLSTELLSADFFES